MKEIVELSKSNVASSMSELQAVFFKKENGGLEVLMAGPSHFSKELTGNESIQRQIIVANPLRLCSKFEIPNEKIKDRIIVIERGDCTFVDKAREAQKNGAAAVIIIDNTPGTNAEDMPMFAMSGDNIDDVKIPVVFLFTKEGDILVQAIENQPDIDVS